MEYRSGSCNIGTYEKRQRLIAGSIGFIITILLFVGIIFLELPVEFRLWLFIPIAGTIITLYQVKEDFCVALGFQGVYNLSENSGKRFKVIEDTFRRQDRIKAMKMIIIGSFGAIFPTIALYLLPV